MISQPERYMKRCEKTLNAIKELSPSEKFGGLTSADFETKVQPMRDIRDEIADLETRLSAARDRRELIDEEALAAEHLVINGIVGDPNYGPDSPLYGATGRKRLSERKSGLTRRKMMDNPT